MKKSRKWLYGILLVLGVAFFYALAQSFLEEGQLFLQVAEACEAGTGEKPVQVLGVVAPGSLKRDPEVPVRFQLAGERCRISVQFAGALPDALEESREALVSGILSANVLKADEVVAKCPSKYR